MNFADLELQTLRRFRMINLWEQSNLIKKKGFSHKKYKILRLEEQALAIATEARKQKEYQKRDIYSLLD